VFNVSFCILLLDIKTQDITRIDVNSENSSEKPIVMLKHKGYEYKVLVPATTAKQMDAQLSKESSTSRLPEPSQNSLISKKVRPPIPKKPSSPLSTKPTSSGSNESEESTQNSLPLLARLQLSNQGTPRPIPPPKILSISKSSSAITERATTKAIPVSVSLPTSSKSQPKIVDFKGISPRRKDRPVSTPMPAVIPPITLWLFRMQTNEDEVPIEIDPTELTVDLLKHFAKEKLGLDCTHNKIILFKGSSRVSPKQENLHMFFSNNDTVGVQVLE